MKRLSARINPNKCAMCGPSLVLIIRPCACEASGHPLSQPLVRAPLLSTPLSPSPSLPLMPSGGKLRKLCFLQYLYSVPRHVLLWQSAKTFPRCDHLPLARLVRSMEIMCRSPHLSLPFPHVRGSDQGGEASALASSRATKASGAATQGWEEQHQNHGQGHAICSIQGALCHSSASLRVCAFLIPLSLSHGSPSCSISSPALCLRTHLSARQKFTPSQKNPTYSKTTNSRNSLAKLRTSTSRRRMLRWLTGTHVLRSVAYRRHLQVRLGKT